MSEPRLLSPMLDGFVMGEAISSHHGISCYPAIEKQSGDKYIVKVISIPQSQVQMAALLLTGAYKNRDEVGKYFLELSKETLEEATLLSGLSRLDGFCEFTAAQVAPLQSGTGYEVYLLSPYRKSVQRMLSGGSLTQRQAMDLTLQMCAALASARRAGWLYADLKPTNIYYSAEGGFRIGDLGFVSLASLKYTSLPEKYLSAYIPAEVADPMAVLNDTMDIYALGLVLYQIYNGGALPIENNGGFAAPLYADYEMAEIILKACAADPKDRWQDPAQMTQAIVSYMQRNPVTDAPIVVPVQPEAEPEETPVEEFLPDEEPDAQELAQLAAEETVPADAALTDTEVSDECARMLRQADDLIAHQTPDPVVAPEPVEVPEPERVEVVIPKSILEDLPKKAPKPSKAPEVPAPRPVKAPVPEKKPEPKPAPKPAPKEAVHEVPAKKELNPKKLLPIAAVLLVLLIGLIIGVSVYNGSRTLTVDKLDVTATVDSLTVRLETKADESLLSVVCTDSYGNARTASVKDGVAVFTDLEAQTRYNLRVEAKDSYKLTGQIATSITTGSRTEILGFTAGIGPADGSVLLSFHISGKDSSQWTVSYTDGADFSDSVTFSGHSITIEGLTVGTEYTFTLSPADDISVSGHTQVIFTAGNLVYAENLTITACGGGSLTVTWDAPEESNVHSWIVRCYDAGGYNETLTVTDTTCTFQGLDHQTPCTVEVFAAGMNQSVHTSISADPITVSGFRFDPAEGTLTVSWDFTGGAPEDGWYLVYTVDGGIMQDVACEGSSAQIPYQEGSIYSFLLEAADGTIIFGGTASFPAG